MKKSTTKIIAIAAVVIAVALLALYLFVPRYSVIKEYPQEAEECDGLTNPNFKNSCYFGIALEKEDAELCAPISVDDHRDICYIAISKTKGKEVCDSITDAYYLRPKCYAELDLTS